MVIGEAPGANEDLQGVPYVGRAGKALDAALARIGKDRWSEVYVTNAVKCRPPGNANPSKTELYTCHPYLEGQIRSIRPLLIVCTGKVAAYQVLGSSDSLKSMRGKVHAYKYTSATDKGEFILPVIVMYHPAYIMRNKNEVDKWKEDWLFVEKVYKKLCIQKVNQ